MTTKTRRLIRALTKEARRLDKLGREHSNRGKGACVHWTATGAARGIEWAVDRLKAAR